MIQHVAEWTCKCADCGQTLKVAIQMDMAKGNYLALFQKHEHPEDSEDFEVFYTTFYTVCAQTLEVLRGQALPRQGYTVVTEG